MPISREIAVSAQSITLYIEETLIKAYSLKPNPLHIIYNHVHNKLSHPDAGATAQEARRGRGERAAVVRVVPVAAQRGARVAGRHAHGQHWTTHVAQYVHLRVCPQHARFPSESDASEF